MPEPDALVRLLEVFVAAATVLVDCKVIVVVVAVVETAAPGRDGVDVVGIVIVITRAARPSPYRLLRRAIISSSVIIAVVAVSGCEDKGGCVWRVAWSSFSPRYRHRIGERSPLREDQVRFQREGSP